MFTCFSNCKTNYNNIYKRPVGETYSLTVIRFWYTGLLRRGSEDFLNTLVKSSDLQIFRSSSNGYGCFDEDLKILQYPCEIFRSSDLQILLKGYGFKVLKLHPLIAFVWSTALGMIKCSIRFCRLYPPPPPSYIGRRGCALIILLPIIYTRCALGLLGYHFTDHLLRPAGLLPPASVAPTSPHQMIYYTGSVFLRCIIDFWEILWSTISLHPRLNSSPQLLPTTKKIYDLLRL